MPNEQQTDRWPYLRALDVERMARAFVAGHPAYRAPHSLTGLVVVVAGDGVAVRKMPGEDAWQVTLRLARVVGGARASFSRDVNVMAYWPDATVHAALRSAVGDIIEESEAAAEQAGPDVKDGTADVKKGTTLAGGLPPPSLRDLAGHAERWLLHLMARTGNAKTLRALTLALAEVRK